MGLAGWCSGIQLSIRSYQSPRLTMLSNPACATKITSASGQALIAAIAPPGPRRQQVRYSRAHAARSGRPFCSIHRMPRRQRCAVRLAPWKITSAVLAQTVGQPFDLLSEDALAGLAVLAEHIRQPVVLNSLPLGRSGGGQPA